MDPKQIRYVGSRSGLDSSASGYGPVAGSYKP
jgi:hypothetical protein